MKIVSLIHEPGVIERFLCHPGLWKQAPAFHERTPKTPSPGQVGTEVLDDGLRLGELARV